MKNARAIIAASLVLMTVLATSCASSGNKYNRKADTSGFVTVKDRQFIQGGKPFRFAGTNNYYMHYESDKMQTDVLDAALGMNFRVIRIWGFFNGLTGANEDHKVYGMTVPAMDGKPALYGIPESKKSAKGLYGCV